MISTKARYALRVMIDIAQQPADSFVPLKGIAARQEISEKYLEIIIQYLVKANLVKAHRGKGGGYVLTRKPSEYKIGEIIEITEGPLACVACLMPSAETCPKEGRCPTLPLWKKYDALVKDLFYNTTLQDLLDGNL